MGARSDKELVNSRLLRILSEPARRRSEGESKDPEDASLAMLFQGVSAAVPRATLPFMRDGAFYKFWVYIMASRTGTLYVGMTGFFDTRVFQHKSEAIEGFTKKYKCHRLVYYESYDNVYTAKRRERQLKGWRREKTIALIERLNPRWQDLAVNWGREMLLPNQSLKKAWRPVLKQFPR